MPDWGGSAEAAQPPPAPSLRLLESRRKGSGNMQPGMPSFEPSHASNSRPQGNCRAAGQSDNFSGLQQQNLEGSHGHGLSEHRSGQDPVDQSRLAPVQSPCTAELAREPRRRAPAPNSPAAMKAAQTLQLQPAGLQGQARHVSAAPQQQQHPAAPPHTSSGGGGLQLHLAAASQRQDAPALPQHVTSGYTVEEPDSPTAPPDRHSLHGIHGWTVPLDSHIAGCLLQDTTGACTSNSAAYCHLQA